MNGDKDLYDIDKYALDVEWEQQPKIYGERAEQLAHATKAYKTAEGQKELAQAKLFLAISANPEEYDLPTGSRGGVTVETIKAAVIVHPKYQKACEQVINTKFKMDLLTGTCRTLEHRKTALEKIDGLEARNYFAEPRESSPESRNHRAEREMDKTFGKKRRTK